MVMREGDVRFGWPFNLGSLANAGVLSVAILVLTMARAARASDGDRLAGAGDDAGAAAAYAREVLTRPDDPTLLQKLGAARYKAGDYDGAARAFDWAFREGAGPEALFNAGHAYWLSGRLEEAVDRYRAADRLGAGGTAADHVSRVEEELAARRAAAPPPPPPPESGEQESPPSPPSEGGEPPPPSEGGEPPPDAGEPHEGAGEEGEGEPPPSEAGATQGGTPEPSEEGMTAAQAEALLDAVDEGHPPLTVSGRPGDKPW